MRSRLGIAERDGIVEAFQHLDPGSSGAGRQADARRERGTLHGLRSA
jgi:hypothetical protein